MQLADFARDLVPSIVGNNNEARTAMIAMITSNSTSVKP